MLTDRSLQLLTAYVDDQLSSRQRCHVEQMLRRSEEARRLLALLQQDSWQLQKLPRPALPCDLSPPILQTIAERGLTTGQPRKVSARAGIPFWKVFAAAAAILLVLGLSSYFYFASVPDPVGPPVALGPEPRPEPRKEPANNSTPTPQKETVPVQIANNANPPNTPSQGPPVKPRPDPAEKNPLVQNPKVRPEPVKPDKSVNPPKVPGSVLADRGLEKFSIVVVELAPPTIVAVTDLEREPARQKLQAELAKAGRKETVSKSADAPLGFRLELPVQDTNKAVLRLQSACKSAGVNLILESLVQSRLKKPNWKTDYAFYLETLTPADLNRLLQALAQGERQAAARKPSEGVLDRLVAVRMTRADWRELADLLGAAFQPPAEQGGTRENDSKQVGKSQLQPGLVLTLPPVRPNRPSPDVKRFLDNRKPPRRDAVPVMIVVRHVG